MPLTAGTRLGSYEILTLVGAGGMGEVYRARDLRLGREVAIKILQPDRLGDEARRRRFVQEAQAASALNHPHIVTIHEIESAGDRDFIVMEYVRGRSLDAVIPRSGMRLGEVLRIAIPVADALAAAHARGIVHRDLKPANVMIGSDGSVKVLDFGLAKLVEMPTGLDETTVTVAIDGDLSVPGTIAGTAAYMAPEQATGGTVDARSDIFSFGAMLYEMATGTRAFAGTSTVDTLAAVIRAQPTPPTAVVPALARELERLILRCLRKDPDRRYQTMRDVSLELQAIKEESDSGRLSASVHAPDRTRRARLIPAVIVAAVAVVAAIAIGWWLQQRAGFDKPDQRLTPLTTLHGRESQPAFAPDGEQVAFEWHGEKQDNEDIYLKLVGSSELRRLTTDGLPDGAPAWSPDGREIAFLRRGQDRTTVYTVSPVTGAERKISDLGAAFVLGLSWSPDGRWLATGRGLPDQGGSSLLLVPVQGGEPRTLTTTKAFAGHPSFSPDGRALAFRACSAPFACSLGLLALDAALMPAGAARTVAPLRSLDLEWAVTWTRDGRSLIYESGRYLWRVAVVGDGAPERLELVGYGALSPALAAHRDRLAFVSQRNTISQHPLDSTHTSPPVLASSYADIEVNFSHDGQRLVFSSTRGGEEREIWTARADGTGARQLTRGLGWVQGSPSFSPDSRQVAFDSQHDDGSWSLFVVDADGGVPRRLTTESGNENCPVWSPDGRWIYYTSDQKAGRNVWRIPAGGGRAEQLTTGGSSFRVRVSPDGRELLYSPPAAANDDAPLLAAPVAGGAPRQLLPCVRAYSIFTNAVGLYYAECGPGPDRNVHLVDAATNRDSVIGRTRDAPYQPSVFAVSPDGKSVLVPRGEWTRDLMLIENFR